MRSCRDNSRNKTKTEQNCQKKQNLAYFSIKKTNCSFFPQKTRLFRSRVNLREKVNSLAKKAKIREQSCKIGEFCLNIQNPNSSSKFVKTSLGAD